MSYEDYLEYRKKHNKTNKVEIWVKSIPSMMVRGHTEVIGVDTCEDGVKVYSGVYETMDKKRAESLFRIEHKLNHRVFVRHYLLPNEEYPIALRRYELRSGRSLNW